MSKTLHIKTPKMNLFRSLAELLFDHLIPEGKNLPLQTEVDELASHKRGSVREYYIRKLTSVLMILTLTGLLAFITFLLTGRQDRSLPQSRLSRPGYGENDMDTSLSLSVSGMKESEDLDIHVSPRKYDKKEVAHLLKKAETQLKQELPGDNSSLEEIRSPLCFPENLVNGTVRAEYTVLPPDILDDDGAIIGQVSEDGTPVSIEAELHLQNQTRTVKYGAIVFPPLLTEEEAFRKELDHALLQADTEDPTA